MSEWQVISLLKSRLIALRWEGGTEPVFHRDSVKVTKTPVRQAFMTLMTPAALIVPGPYQNDPAHREEPDLLVGRVVVKIMVAHQDSLGQAQLLGANQVGGFTSSKGRGVKEIIPEIIRAVKVLNQRDLIDIELVAQDGGEGQTEDSYLRYWEDLVFEYRTPAGDYFPGPEKLAGAVSGSTVTLTWKNPISRSDRDSLILRRSSGATPPELVTDSSSVAVSGFVETVNDSPGAGTHSYALFMKYLDGSTPLYSAPDTVTVTV